MKAEKSRRSKGKAARPRGREQTKEALLKAAGELFGAKGPDAVSVRDVAGLAGVNQGLVHRHFGSKEQLIRGLAERDGAALRAAAANTDDLATALKQMFGVIEENPSFIRVIAYLLLEGYQPSDYMTRTGGLSRLAELADPSRSDAKSLKAAIFASRIMGWLLFEPYLLYSSSYGGDPREARAAVLREVLEDAAQFTEKARAGAKPAAVLKPGRKSTTKSAA
jgi:TetR/AcrR family transcriptional regulator, repressor for neighboring sulfatase